MNNPTPAINPMPGLNHYAAIDLGSNSFHLVIAEPEGASIRIIDSLRMPVRLGAGLDKRKRIRPQTFRVALDALAQFAQRLRGIPKHQVRAVGTNTLRRARNADEFMREALYILGKPIEIISGREEARLIYAAVAHSLPDLERRRLVIDIGGGSTELVVGTGYSPSLVESLSMGCVSYSNQYIKPERLSMTEIKRATCQAQVEMQPIERAYRNANWSEVIGCSGTIKATARLLAERSITDGEITRDGVRKLIRQLTGEGLRSAQDIESIGSDRAQVIAGGLAILHGIMKTLGIDRMQASQVALREGLIFDMIGKAEHVDLQTQTLANLVTRYSIDAAQSRRVRQTARTLFAQAAKAWQLDPELDVALLDRAAQLHEIGKGVAHTQYHKHGAYILEHSDMFGFTLAEQKALALLVRFHRRRIDLSAFDPLPTGERERLLRLLSLLRIAALLHRGRHSDNLKDMTIKVSDNRLILKIPQDWLDEHPLTRAELREEAERLLHIDVRLDSETREAVL